VHEVLREDQYVARLDQDLSIADDVFPAAGDAAFFLLQDRVPELANVLLG